MSRAEYVVVAPGGRPDPDQAFTELAEAVVACWTAGGESVWAREVTDWVVVHP